MIGTPTPPPAGDALAQVLAQWHAAPSPAATARVYAALSTATLLVPVTATLLTSEVDATTGLPAEKSSEMSVVTLVGPDGTTALPVFTTAEAMAAWRTDVRPVQVDSRSVCASAVAEGHVAVLVDVTRSAFVVRGSALAALADGYVPVGGRAADEPAATLSSRRVGGELIVAPPATPPSRHLVETLAAALSHEPAVRAAYLVETRLPGEDPSLACGLVLGSDLDLGGLGGLARRVSGTLRSAGALRGADTLDLFVLTEVQRRGVQASTDPAYEAERTDGPRRWPWRGR